MQIQKLSATFTKPSDVTAYASGDIIANSLTANLVMPMEFGKMDQGKIYGARCVIKPATGNLVITALDFDLLIFRAMAGIPFADAGYLADNAIWNVSDAQMKELVAVIPFVNGAWRNQAGTLVAGTAGYQDVRLAVPRLFTTSGAEKACLRGLLQAKGIWTPGAVAQAISIDLDVEA